MPYGSIKRRKGRIGEKCKIETSVKTSDVIKVRRKVKMKGKDNRKSTNKDRTRRRKKGAGGGRGGKKRRKKTSFGPRDVIKIRPL